MDSAGLPMSFGLRSEAWPRPYDLWPFVWPKCDPLPVHSGSTLWVILQYIRPKRRAVLVWLRLSHQLTLCRPLSPPAAQEWDAEQKVKMEKRMEAMLNGWNPDDGDEPPEEAEEEEDDLPFACYICRRAWADCPSEAVVTRCRHYFCQTCALKCVLPFWRPSICLPPSLCPFEVMACFRP